MAKRHIGVVTLILLTACYAATTSEAMDTAYDILAKNNLPRGLLPKGVQSYNLGPGGKIDVTLPGECNFFVPLGGQKYKMQFAINVGGVIQPGSIHEVHGVSLQVKFAWLGINQVELAGNQITLQAQNFKQAFPVSSFAVSPSCS